MKTRATVLGILVLSIFLNGCASTSAVDTLDRVERETSDENAQKQVEDVENVKKKYEGY
jgi:hypothetical protein